MKSLYTVDSTKIMLCCIAFQERERAIQYAVSELENQGYTFDFFENPYNGEKLGSAYTGNGDVGSMLIRTKENVTYSITELSFKV